MTRTDTTDVSRPGAWARFRSRQSGCPSGPVGRLFGRLMVPTTAPANDAAIDALDLATPSLRPGSHRRPTRRARPPGHRDRPVGHDGPTSTSPQSARHTSRHRPPRRRRRNPSAARRRHRRRRSHRPHDLLHGRTRHHGSPRSLVFSVPAARSPSHASSATTVSTRGKTQPSTARPASTTSTTTSPPPDSSELSTVRSTNHLECTSSSDAHSAENRHRPSSEKSKPLQRAASGDFVP